MYRGSTTRFVTVMDPLLAGNILHYVVMQDVRDQQAEACTRQAPVKIITPALFYDPLRCRHGLELGFAFSCLLGGR